MTDHRLKDPAAHFPGAPAWGMAVCVSQAVQEEKMESIEKQLEALWKKEDERPCGEHGERISKMEGRMDGQQEGEQRTWRDSIKEHPVAASSGGILGVILAVLGVLIKAGVIG